MKLANIEEHKLAPIFVVLAAICWGLIGIFSRILSDNGLSSIQITTSRCFVTAVSMIIYLLLRDKNKLKIDLKDIWYFLGTGIGSIVFFNICFFLTIQVTTLSVAVILLYTAPCFVVILSAIFFREKITRQKIMALLLAFIGCVLVTGIIGNQSVKLTWVGLVTGIGSGFGYALYSIFGSIALKKYHTMTVTAYTFIIASLSIIPFSNFVDLTKIIIMNNEVLVNVLLIGIVSTLIAFLLYTKGLQHMEAGKASVMAFVEPMVATIAGIILFEEKLNIQNILGIVLIFVSVILLNIKIKKKTAIDNQKASLRL